MATITDTKFYKQMNWKPKVGSIYCVMDKDTNKLDLFYEVIELEIGDYLKYGVEPTKEAEYLHITYKVYDYRHNKKVNIYYVKLQPLFIGNKHAKQDLVLYFKHGHGADNLATHTITDANNTLVYKTADDTQATRTKLKKLLINNLYLCKYNNFECGCYSVEDFYTLYNIFWDGQNVYQIISPYKSLYYKLMHGEHTYDCSEFTKQRFNELCCYKNIYEELKNPNQDDEEEEASVYNDDSDDSDDNDEVVEVLKDAETDEEIKMF